ncbi:MAG: beta-N-acetylhexosaminidase [Gammaproteobacteria bacterium]|nr:beta-N-acetylhexosaminidase [Gammaproteobacteria bacterium]MCH9743905.1 beta-N-acetylhexosaminidase [Gammaproteobacteria bacterium]
MTTASAIIDIEGCSVSQEEQELIQHPSIAGIILFARNYQDTKQLKALTRQIKAINNKLLIAVDQEGGRVQRFRDGFTELPAMSHWGANYSNNAEALQREFIAMLEVMLTELRAVGVDMTLAPVLDIDFQKSAIIGERSFSRDPDVVTALASIFINVLHRFEMPATGKHFPGHGAVALDSHKSLPVDSREFKQLAEIDLQPYKRLLDKLDAIMPAHIIYSQVDPNVPASFSSIWLRDILRQQWQFQGVIISDDISMEAAASIGGYEDRAMLALEAGCDLVTICNNHEGAIQALGVLEKWHDESAHLRIQGLKRERISAKLK